MCFGYRPPSQPAASEPMQFVPPDHREGLRAQHRVLPADRQVGWQVRGEEDEVQAADEIGPRHDEEGSLVLLDPPSPDHCANPRSAAGAPHRALTLRRQGGLIVKAVDNTVLTARQDGPWRSWIRRKEFADHMPGHAAGRSEEAPSEPGIKRQTAKLSWRLGPFATAKS
jgi:hypothetical protein